jgi:hypothetical protein
MASPPQQPVVGEQVPLVFLLPEQQHLLLSSLLGWRSAALTSPLALSAALVASTMAEFTQEFLHVTRH